MIGEPLLYLVLGRLHHIVKLSGRDSRSFTGCPDVACGTPRLNSPASIAPPARLNSSE
jgi:hypothetical protein